MTMIADFRSLIRGLEANGEETHPQPAPWPPDLASGEPEEMVTVWQRARSELIRELIARIHAQSAEFFECLVIDLLLSMGYGDRRRDPALRLGRTGDGGVDGLIAQDELGLELIYIQAKRLKPGSVVPVADVRDFAGSLDARHAVKGVFFATSHFSAAAVEFCNRLTQRVALVDGERLAELMIRHNIGVRVQESFQFKCIDRDYFAPAAVRRMRQTIPVPERPGR